MRDQLVAPVKTEEGTPALARTESDILTLLRGNSARRPVVDPGLCGGLRDWLEDGLCSVNLDPTRPLVITKQSLRNALAGRQDRTTSHQSVTPAIALGALVDALFRQFVTIGRIDDPMADGLDALSVDPRHSEVFDFIRALDGPERTDLRDELETQAAILVSKWPSLAPAWLPRTQERIAIPLAGGGAVLVGVIDLLVGAPSSGRASVGLVEVKSGRARPDDREDLRFYALLETLRSGAAPFRIATFYTRTGQVAAEDVNDELLAASVQRVISATARLAAPL